ncbi:MAG: hypothetical protein KA515_00185 [Candidatus Pacebacteria bacterium]|nr:hypothetical protein [Candidatus Paceibacterota bacterium]
MRFNFYKSLTIYSLVILFVLFNFVTTIHAQTPTDVSINVVPENPTPGGEVSLSLSSYSVDLDASQITWSVGGKTLLSGLGKTTLSLTAPALGAETSVNIRIRANGTIIDTKAVLNSSRMIVLWQADDSYTPPFYKGRALPAPDSGIKIVAIPEIKTGSSFVNPKNMTYTWRKDYTNDQEAAGYGKNYFTYNSDYLDPSNYIEVSATTIDQKYSSSSALDVGTFKPKLLFYKKDENLGTMFENALADGHKISDKEILFAAPYFISPKNIRIPRLTWTWSLNDQMVQNGSFVKNLLPLQVQSGVSGTSKLKLEVENMDKLTQSVKNEITLEF